MSWRNAVAAFVAMRPIAVLDSPSCTRKHASSCELCAAVCPKEAITLDPLGASVEEGACIGCGLCSTVCPVEAISGVGQVPSAIAQKLAAGKALRCDVARVLEPERDEDVVDVPCVASVHPEALAAGALAGEGAKVVTGPCTDCPFGSQTQTSFVLDEARAIVDARRSGAVIRVETVVDHVESPRRSKNRPVDRPRPEMSRRSLFGLRKAPRTSTANTDALLDMLPGASAREVLLTVDEHAPQPQIRAEPACTACSGCVAICPVDALTLEQGELWFHPQSCVGCGECVRICPEQALRRDGWAQQAANLQLITVELGHCERCSRPLGPGEDGTCHNCRTRSSLASGIL